LADTAASGSGGQSERIQIEATQRQSLAHVLGEAEVAERARVHSIDVPQRLVIYVAQLTRIDEKSIQVIGDMVDHTIQRVNTPSQNTLNPVRKADEFTGVMQTQGDDLGAAGPQ